VQELAQQQERILTKEDNLYIQQLAPKAYISPIFTREQERNGIATQSSQASAKGKAKK
jgi:hypothetical protein